MAPSCIVGPLRFPTVTLVPVAELDHLHSDLAQALPQNCLQGVSEHHSILGGSSTAETASVAWESGPYDGAQEVHRMELQQAFAGQWHRLPPPAPSAPDIRALTPEASLGSQPTSLTLQVGLVCPRAGRAVGAAGDRPGCLASEQCLQQSVQSRCSLALCTRGALLCFLWIMLRIAEPTSKYRWLTC